MPSGRAIRRAGISAERAHELFVHLADRRRIGRQDLGVERDGFLLLTTGDDAAQRGARLGLVPDHVHGDVLGIDVASVEGRHPVAEEGTRRP